MFDREGHARAIYGEAVRHLEEGRAVIPIGLLDKKPLIKWLEYQELTPSLEELDRWAEQFGAFNIALITGHRSGVVILDADNDEAVRYCYDHGLASGWSVKTRRGRHFYYAHPGGRVMNAKNLFGVPGLDLRGDGGYALLPPSQFSKDGAIIDGSYTLETSIDWEDLPVWGGYTASSAAPTALEDLDLTTTRVVDWRPIREQMAGKDKLRPGQGRGTMVTRYVGELVASGVVDAALIFQMVEEFETEFFAEPLPTREIEACIRSILAGDKLRHPERHEAAAKLEPAAAEPEIKLFTADHLADLAKVVGERVFLIDPWLPKGGIIEINGYSGHGKSLFAMAALWHLAGGRDFGTYLVKRPAKVLYFDLENGTHTLLERMRDLSGLFNPGGLFNIYSPAVGGAMGVKGVVGIDLRDEESLKRIETVIRMSHPEVIVIDTIRSAMSGFEETKAEAWGPLNNLLLKLRSAGLTVVFVHHSRKPGETGLVTESGSTAQLVHVDTQVHVTKLVGAPKIVDPDEGMKAAKEAARQQHAIGDWSEWNRLASEATADYWLRGASRISYGKIRDETVNHSIVNVGFAYHRETGALRVVTAPNTKIAEVRTLARAMGIVTPTAGEIKSIAHSVGAPPRLVSEWLR